MLFIIYKFACWFELKRSSFVINFSIGVAVNYHGIDFPIGDVHDIQIDEAAAIISPNPYSDLWNALGGRFNPCESDLGQEIILVGPFSFPSIDPDNYLILVILGSGKCVLLVDCQVRVPVSEFEHRPANSLDANGYGARTSATIAAGIVSCVLVPMTKLRCTHHYGGVEVIQSMVFFMRTKVLFDGRLEEGDMGGSTREHNVRTSSLVKMVESLVAFSMAEMVLTKRSMLSSSN